MRQMSPTGKIWPVRFVMWQKCRTFVRGVIEPLREIRLAQRRHRKRHLLEDDAIAADALLPGVEHAPVVLVRRDDLVARREVEPELRDLQRLAGVACDGELLGVAAELAREPLTHRLDVRLEHLPHVIRRRLVRDVEVALHRLVHCARTGADTTVVQVDQRAVEGERLLDLPPEILVGRHVFRGASGDGLRRVGHAGGDVRTGHGHEGGGAGGALQELAAAGGMHAGDSSRGRAVRPWASMSAVHRSN
jgi:hypothetical protein